MDNIPLTTAIVLTFAVLLVAILVSPDLRAQVRIFNWIELIIHKAGLDDAQAAVEINQLLCEHNENFTRAVMSGDGRYLLATTTAEEAVRAQQHALLVKQSMAQQGWRSLQLLVLTPTSDLEISRIRAKATVDETWRFDTGRGQQLSVTGRNEYVLTRSNKAWRITHCDSFQAIPPASLPPADERLREGR